MKEIKEKQINVRVSQIEFDELKMKSDELKITKSEFILKLIFGEKIKKNTSKENLKFLQAINKIGNNLNQAVRTLHTKNMKDELKDEDYEKLLNKLIIIEEQLNNIFIEVTTR
jgi:hypothetical protein